MPQTLSKIKFNEQKWTFFKKNNLQISKTRIDYNVIIDPFNRNIYY